MLAYNKQTLEHLHIHEEVEEALQLHLLSKRQVKEIKAHYPVDLYRPNFFVAIGLGLLTMLVVLAGFGLFGLLTNFNSLSGPSFVYGIACYACLEYMVKVKKHFGTGVDVVLMVAFVACITAAFTSLFTHNKHEEIASLFCSGALSLFLAFRFVDSAMALAGGVLLLSLIYILITIDYQANLLLVYAVMVICSIVISFGSFKASTIYSLRFHKSILRLLGYLGLVAIYVCSNYYIVQNQAIMARGGYYDVPVFIPITWFYWGCTILIPLIYLAVGLRRKNLVVARMGIVLGIFSIITFRYYFALLPLEMVLMGSGILLIVGSFLLIRYLHTARYGYIFKAEDNIDAPSADIEALTTVEAYEAAGNIPAATDNHFGGGNFGGGGSGGRY